MFVGHWPQFCTYFIFALTLLWQWYMFGMSKIKFYVYTLSRACGTGEGKTKLIWVSMKLIKFTLHPRRILLVISFPTGSSSPLASASEKSTVIASILSPLLKYSYWWLTEEKISLKTFPWGSPFCLFKRHRATGVPAWRERTWNESRLYFQHYSYTYMHLSLDHSLFSHRPECTVFTPPPPNFAYPLSSIFIWEDCNTQEKLKTMVLQNLGRGEGNKMHYDLCEMVDLTVTGYIFFECKVIYFLS